MMGYQNISPRYRKHLQWILGGLTLVLLFFLHRIDGFLLSEEVPHGIVDFELAGNIHKARLMMDSWDEQARVAVGLSLGIDYLFMFAYAFFLSLLSFEMAQKHKFKTGYWISMAILLAGLFDAIENIALIKLLTGCQYAVLPEIAKVFALLKFSIVAITVIYILLSWLLLLRVKKT